jgi:hypothetical protein
MTHGHLKSYPNSTTLTDVIPADRLDGYRATPYRRYGKAGSEPRASRFSGEHSENPPFNLNKDGGKPVSVS